jgi:outer membrane protein assembly factor BamB
VITLGALVGIVWVRWSGGLDRQQANMQSAKVAIVAGALALIWWAAFSRVRAWRRVQGALLLVVCFLGFFGLFRFHGVDGDLVPIFEWRFRSDAVVSAPPGLYDTLTGLADSPQFFGPTRDGRVPDPGLRTDWQAAPPAELWRRQIGAGWSGFAVAGEYAITQEQRGEDEVVVCLNLSSGGVRWTHSDRAHYDNPVAGEGPRTTPTVHGDWVFTLGSTGILNCLVHATGKLRWTKNILEDNSATLPEWGVAGSPLIVGALVVVSAGGPDGRSLVAYEQRNGERVWSGGDAPTHWSTPVLMTLAGRRQILIFNEQLTAHDAESGAVLWQYPWRKGHPHVCLPMAVGPDTVLVSSGYGTGSHLVRVLEQPGQKFRAEEVWRSLQLKSKFANVVVDGGFAYGLDDGILTCVDLANGQRRWKRGRYGHGQLLLVGKHLLLMSEHGEVVLLEATPEKHHEWTRMRVFEDKTWNPPALAGRYLLVRNDREAACFQLPVVKR